MLQGKAHSMSGVVEAELKLAENVVDEVKRILSKHKFLTRMVNGCDWFHCPGD